MSSGSSLHGSGARKEGRGRWLSSRGVRRSPWCGRGRTGATTVLKGISGDGGSVEVDAVGSGRASARGSACPKERRVAELLDTAARRGDEGEHGYSGGAATVASAMTWEREGEELGANGGVQEGRGATWSSSRPSGRQPNVYKGTTCWRHRARNNSSRAGHSVSRSLVMKTTIPTQLDVGLTFIVRGQLV